MTLCFLKHRCIEHFSSEIIKLAGELLDPYATYTSTTGDNAGHYRAPLRCRILIPYIRHSSVHISARADRCDISRNTTGGPLTYDHELPEHLAISLARAPAAVALFGRIYCCQQRRQSQHTHSRQVRHTLLCITVFVHAHTYWHVPHCSRTLHTVATTTHPTPKILYTPTTALPNSSHCTPLVHAHLDSTSLPPAQSAITCTIGTRQHTHCYSFCVLLYTSSMELPYSVPTNICTCVCDAARTALTNSTLTTTQHHNSAVSTALFYFL